MSEFLILAALLVGYALFKNLVVNPIHRAVAPDNYSDTEWDRWQMANKSLTMAQGIHVMKAKMIHGVLTLALVDGREDLVEAYCNGEKGETWEDGAEFELHGGWDGLGDYYVEKEHKVQGVKALFWGDPGPYTMDTWHSKIVKRFPKEQAEALLKFQLVDRVGSRWLHGIFMHLD